MDYPENGDNMLLENVTPIQSVGFYFLEEYDLLNISPSDR